MFKKILITLAPIFISVHVISSDNPSNITMAEARTLIRYHDSAACPTDTSIRLDWKSGKMFVACQGTIIEVPLLNNTYSPSEKFSEQTPSTSISPINSKQNPLDQEPQQQTPPHQQNFSSQASSLEPLDYNDILDSIELEQATSNVPRNIDPDLTQKALMDSQVALHKAQKALQDSQEALIAVVQRAIDNTPRGFTTQTTRSNQTHSPTP